MITVIDNLKIKLEWRHSNPLTTLEKLSKESIEFKKEKSKDFFGTECICTVMSDTEIEEPLVFTTKAKLFPKDNFWKDKGRRISLQRIIQEICGDHSIAQTGLEQATRVNFNSKTFRKQLWDFYLSRTNPKLFKTLHKN